MTSWALKDHHLRTGSVTRSSLLLLFVRDVLTCNNIKKTVHLLISRSVTCSVSIILDCRSLLLTEQLICCYTCRIWVPVPLPQARAAHRQGLDGCSTTFPHTQRSTAVHEGSLSCSEHALVFIFGLLLSVMQVEMATIKVGFSNQE